MKKILLCFIVLIASLTINATVKDTIKISFKMPKDIKLTLPSIVLDTVNFTQSTKDTVFWLNNGVTSTFLIDTMVSHPVKQYLTTDDLVKFGFVQGVNVNIGSTFINEIQSNRIHNNKTPNINLTTPTNKLLTDSLVTFLWYGTPSGTIGLSKSILDEGESIKIGYNFTDISDIQFINLYKNNDTIPFYTTNSIDSVLYIPTYTGKTLDSVHVKFGNWEDTVDVYRTYTLYQEYKISARYIDQNTTEKQVIVGDTLFVDDFPIKLCLTNNITKTNPAKLSSNSKWISNNSIFSTKDTIDITTDGEYVYNYDYNNKSYYIPFIIKLKNEHKYSLNVVDGYIINPINLDNKYLSGTDVTIVANNPYVGKYFDKWTSNYNPSFVSVKDTIVFTMPSNDVVLTANYCDLPIYTFNDNPINENIITIHSFYDVNELKVNDSIIVSITKLIKDSITQNIPENFEVIDTFTNICGKQFITKFTVTISNIFVNNEKIEIGNIYSNNGKLIINLYNNNLVKVYSITGMLVVNKFIQNEVLILPKGIYIIVIENKTYKIII